MPSAIAAFGHAPAIVERSGVSFLTRKTHGRGTTCPLVLPLRCDGARRLVNAAASCCAADARVAEQAPNGYLPKPVVKTVEFAPGKMLTFETGQIARQAAGSIVVRQGDTIVICTACAEQDAAPGIDFLPLRVDYAEKFSSAGRTSGSYIKREGRPSQHEVLASRLIDRPLRPMFADGYHSEVQVLANVFSYDGVNPGDALAICGCAAALHISHIPLLKPVAAVRVAYRNGSFIVSPTVEDSNASITELVVAGTRDAVLMIEGTCEFLTEEQVLEAIEIAQTSIAKICNAMDELRTQVGKDKIAVTPKRLPVELFAKMVALSADLEDTISVPGKKNREAALQTLKDRVLSELSPSAVERAADPQGCDELDAMLRVAWKSHLSDRMRELILVHNKRPDGRRTTDIRPITIVQRFLPCAHGSSLFTRGETQALAVATLGGEEMAQRFENLEGENAARFYLQYSFPPFSVGEVGRTGAPGRREVGHGKLAERALAAVLPPRESFPYVVRVESSIMESCGSSSMASVCGGCLALMDAGVPILQPVAGIAMGLIADSETGHVSILTDILGLEDALGDMDFKVAGTSDGITALQMDIKIEGISIDIMRMALDQAKVGRLNILNEMMKAQPSICADLPSSLPRVRTVTVPVRKIGDIIGPGGKNIKSIIERCGGEGSMSINIEDTGIVSVSSQDEEMIDRAVTIIESMTTTISVGTRHAGTVTKILPFGAYIAIGTGKEGWLHISELEKKRTTNVEDVCKVGDKINVEVIEVGRNGQFRVSRKVCLDDAEVDVVGLSSEARQGLSTNNT
jgi:polyribonucleotide nucleotidyltransferase